MLFFSFRNLASSAGFNFTFRIWSDQGFIHEHCFYLLVRFSQPRKLFCILFLLKNDVENNSFILVGSRVKND